MSTSAHLRQCQAPKHTARLTTGTLLAIKLIGCCLVAMSGAGLGAETEFMPDTSNSEPNALRGGGGTGESGEMLLAPASPQRPGPEPAPVRNIRYEIGVGIPTGTDLLPGILMLPASTGRVPAVVLIHGSGPHDRDETIGPNKPFLDIAIGLAEKGIATLRYEKRTFRNRSLVSDPRLTIDMETTDDAVHAVEYLALRREVDPERIYILGHSQGGMMAPRVARISTLVSGVIMFAAPARPLLDLIVEQQRRVALMDDGIINDAEMLMIEHTRSSTHSIRNGSAKAFDRGPMGLSAHYWRSVDAVDAIAEAKAIRQPMLLLQGGRDLQVVSADWLRWKRAFADTSRVSFAYHDTLNHLGMHERGPGSLHSYQAPGKVSADLIDDIALWIDLLRGLHDS